jgi:hypothetical protein
LRAAAVTAFDAGFGELAAGIGPGRKRERAGEQGQIE